MVDDGSVVTGWFADLCVADVARSVRFYAELLDLDVAVDHRWYAELSADGQVVLALVSRGHETVPAIADTPPAGVLVSFEVDDVDPVVERLCRMDLRTVWPLSTELGQRHVMVQDPDGTIVDVIERTPLTPADRRRLAAYRAAAGRR
jgi:catechol 2,3-dioxygenase-like lactoylglutathione lyase family enzyme